MADREYSTEELRERAQLLATIAKAEAEASSTDIDELRERANLLVQITEAEAAQ